MKLLLFLITFLSLKGFTQSIKRETISPTGNSSSNNGTTLLQTVGQPYQTHTQQSENISFRPGFQQSIFKTELISSTINVNLFPNPAVFSFFIECSETLFEVTLSVYDAAGKLVYSEYIKELNKQEVNCKTWANGTYVINLTDKKGNFISTKLIKYL
jgi:hypothetical protein